LDFEFPLFPVVVAWPTLTLLPDIAEMREFDLNFASTLLPDVAETREFNLTFVSEL
jgi:hypothetical protein